ncbi:formate--phosphoribosylaminoimidazolecarboxamide ligase [Nitrososphaera sp.]|uniref:formate--phosphoribosylaminoimidazolecarboxamide ligase n=1 Tax=Nitrososphaera sp. TaxID=1971748 RepID=UPI002ED923EC
MAKGKAVTIATLGSHCALQVLKGAKNEGFKTLLVCEKKRAGLYERFGFIDSMILVDSFSEFLNDGVQAKLKRANAVLVPHGTLISQMSSDQIEKIDTPIFGNKWILRWEADRGLKQRLMEAAGLRTPRPVVSKDDIGGLCIVKLHGAAGGRGYYLAWDRQSFEEGAKRLVQRNMIKGEQDLYIQEFVRGVPVYLQYFFSPLTKELELLGVDRRYESDIDGMGRIPARQQLGAGGEPSYTVVGNIPLVLRESLLDEVYRMGEGFCRAAERLVKPGMPGPFCLEGVYDSEGHFTTFEFSARIVAGTNLYVDGSPYSDLLYDEPMSMGRRIAREVKMAKKKGRLADVVT